MFWKKRKKADLEISEIVKILIAVAVMVVVAIAFVIMFQVKGGQGLNSIKNLMHFGK